jgi:glycosyltransferase involved in cell wall biosynthesis
MGHLLPKQGIEMIIKNISTILKYIPNLKFKIIGGGKYQDRLKKIVKKLSVEKHCEFKGRIKENIDVENEIAKSAVAIAPYKKTKDNYTYYADPGKVKTYLACGVPVLLTGLPWNAKEIEDKKCGMIISGKRDDLIEKLILIMRPEINKKFRKNARKYSESFDYRKVFSELNF